MDITEKEFIEIIEKNDARLKHLCRIYAEGEEQRKDLYQEILIQLYHSLPSFKGEAKIGTWLYRLAINTAISMKRRQKTRHRYLKIFRKQKNVKAQNNYDTPRSFEQDERVDQLYEAISELGSSEKAIITMYLEEFSYAEIAYVTDITENYVGVKLNRIKKKLSKIMRD